MGNTSNQKSPATRQCRLIRYGGDVQGVGFRYTAMRLAEGFDLAGYVRNLPGGQVEILVEGDAEQVEGFLEAVRERMAGYITDTDDQPTPCQGLTSFNIRF